MKCSLIRAAFEAHIPAKDVLKMMTTNAARLLGIEKCVDIIATNASPLDDINTLKSVWLS